MKNKNLIFNSVKKELISENLHYTDLQLVNNLESTPKTDFETKFAQFLAEEAKAVEKKTTKEVEETQEHNFDYSNKSNLDNQIGQEALNGIYFESKQNPDKDLEEIRKIVAKNLEKDSQYYMKNAAFGVDGLGYEEAEAEEVSGKHKESGYSDKLKKAMGKDEMVKENIKAIIQKVLEEGTINEAATQELAKMADSYAGFDGMKAVVVSLHDVVTEIERFYDNTIGKSQKIFDSMGEVRNEEGLKVGGFLSPAVESAFNKDLRPVIKQGFTKGLDQPKVKVLSQADLDAARMGGSGESLVNESPTAKGDIETLIKLVKSAKNPKNLPISFGTTSVAIGGTQYDKGELVDMFNGRELGMDSMDIRKVFYNANQNAEVVADKINASNSGIVATIGYGYGKKPILFLKKSNQRR